MRSDYDRIAAAIRFIVRDFPNQPTLKEIASEMGLSPFHFQRLFQRWAGISPKRFLQFLTVEYAKERLDRSKSVLETTFEAGLSGPSRLHDHFVSLEAVTPGEYKENGSFKPHRRMFPVARVGARRVSTASSPPSFTALC